MEKLGIEPTQLLTQIFNFALLVFVLTKLLYKPILKTLDERKKKIEQGLEFRDKMEAELEKTEIKRQAVIDSAREDAKKIITDAKKTAKKVEADIIEQAQKNAISIAEKGRLEIQQERQEIEKVLRLQTVAIAKSWVETVLGNVLTHKNHQQIINKKIEEMGKISE